MTDTAKVLIVVLILIIWAWFVYLGLTPASDFIQMLREGLIAFGVFKTTITHPNSGGLL